MESLKQSKLLSAQQDSETNLWLKFETHTMFSLTATALSHRYYLSNFQLKPQDVHFHI